MKLFSFFLAALPLLLLVGCSSESPQSLQEKKTELCTNLARLNTAIATLKSMGPSSTVGDVRAARDQVKTAFSDVKSSAQGVQEARVADLERTQEDLDKAVQGIPDTATLQQASASIAPQVAAVETAHAQMQSGLNCP